MDTIGQLLRCDTFWSAISAVATVFAAGGIFLARKQLRFDAWLKAQEIFNGKEFTEARGRVFARLDTEPREWTGLERNEGLDVCRKMDELAWLIPHLPKRTVLRVWGDPFRKAWLVLAPLVEEERVKCAWSKKWEAFERVGKEALRRHPWVKKDHSR